MSAAAGVPLCVMDHEDPELLEDLLQAVRALAHTGAFIGGEAVESFEAHYRRFCEAEHVIGVSSGTEALLLSLRALGVGPGDEVIVPANSFVATAEAVSLAGAQPRFADVERDTQLVTAATIADALTAGVVCVIPVHLYGRTVELDPIIELARKHGLSVLEDAAQAHGARYRGRRVGTIGDAGTFSFYPAKNLGAWGDAGAVVTNRVELADQIRLLRSHGESPRYHHRMIGTTARLDAIQAAILSRKLVHLEDWNQRRRLLAAELREQLSDAKVLTLPTGDRPGGDHVYHQFVVRSRRRDKLKAALEQRGISTAVHYPVPIHRSEAYSHLAQDHDVAPLASALADEVLSLPIFPTMSEGQLRKVIQALHEADEELSRSPADLLRLPD